MSSTNRPLSPHLQVYKLPLSAKLSIAHRLTGLFLSLGLVLFTYWLFRVVTDASIADTISNFFSQGFGLVLLYFWIFTFCYHFCNGIRHLFWDAGKGYDVSTVNKSGVAVLVLAVVLTVVIFFVGRSI